MAALTSPSFVVLFACSWSFVLCQGTLKETVNAGDNATLQCQSYRGADIIVIKWSRPDLRSDDGYVFYFSEGHLKEIYQHPSFRGRVELRDPEMKDGDASVILKKITINDTGTYECWVRKEKETGKPKPISIIRLTVTDPGHTAGDKERNVGMSVGLPVCVILLLLGVVGFLIFKIYRRPTENEQPAAPENEPMQAAEPADEDQ